MGIRSLVRPVGEVLLGRAGPCNFFERAVKKFVKKSSRWCLVICEFQTSDIFLVRRTPGDIPSRIEAPTKIFTYLRLRHFHGNIGVNATAAAAACYTAVESNHPLKRLSDEPRFV